MVREKLQAFFAQAESAFFNLRWGDYRNVSLETQEQEGGGRMRRTALRVIQQGLDMLDLPLKRGDYRDNGLGRGMEPKGNGPHASQHAASRLPDRAEDLD